MDEQELVLEVAKRRRVVAAAAYLCLDALTPREERSPRLVRTRADWSEHVAFAGRNFGRRYRLDLAGFKCLLEMIHEEISTQNVAMARRSSGVEVSAEARLAMTLRYLAGGSFLDIQLDHGVRSLCWLHSQFWFFCASARRGIQCSAATRVAILVSAATRYGSSERTRASAEGQD